MDQTPVTTSAPSRVLGKDWQEYEVQFLKSLSDVDLVGRLMGLVDKIYEADKQFYQALGQWAIVKENLPEDVEQIKYGRQILNMAVFEAFGRTYRDGGLIIEGEFKQYIKDGHADDHFPKFTKKKSF